MRSESLEKLADMIRDNSPKAEVVFRNRARRVKKFEDRAFCHDCKGSILMTPVYMVNHTVWNHEADTGHTKGKGFLHIHCLQERLGRPLVAEDFTTAACNLLVVWALKQ